MSTLLSRILWPIVEWLIAAIILLFFASFADHPHVLSALHAGYQFLQHVFTGRQMASEHGGIMAVNVWSSLRLMLFGIVFSLVIGLFLTLTSVLVGQGPLRPIRDILVVVLDAIPEPIYVIAIFVFAFIATLRWNWTLPGVFPLSVPTFADTVIPGLAIAVPGALYLQRMLYLSFENEVSADYVMTARSKGASRTRVVFRHIWPNLMSTVVTQFPVVVGVVLSSVLFAEFFFGYQGLYFRFTSFVGWTMHGPAINRVTLLPEPPATYSIGVAFIAALILVTFWFLANGLSRAISARARFRHTENSPGAHVRRVDWRWIAAGGFPIAVILFFSLFPGLLTNQNPHTEHLLRENPLGIPPFPPSRLHPLGTDAVGRDMLAQTLHGTFHVIGVAGLITLVSTLVALAIAIGIASDERGHLVGAAVRMGRVVASLPTFLLLFFVLYQRNVLSHSQTIVYIAWLCAFEIARSVFAFLAYIEECKKFSFVQGATSVGRSPFGIVVNNLRPWLMQFTCEFFFAEFGRVISMMTILAMFSIYPAEHVVYLMLLDSTSLPAVQSLHISWLADIGDWANQVGGVIAYPYLIAGPLGALLLTMIGAGLISRGIRGREAR